MTELEQTVKASSNQAITQEYPLKELAESVLRKIKAKGASQAEVAASISKGFSTTVRLGEVDTVEHNRDRGFDITVYFGKRKGSASSSDLSEHAIDEAIDAACAIAKYIAEDEQCGLAEAELLAKNPPDCDLYHPVDFTPEQAVEKAKACEAAGLAYSDKITNSEGATFSMHEGYYIYANSHGFSGDYPTSRYSLVCSLIAKSGDEMQRDYEYTTSRKFENLRQAEEVATRAAEKAVSRCHSRRLRTMMAPICFVPDCARGLLGSLVSAISGGQLYRRTSFLLDSLNTEIAAPWMQLVEHAHLPAALGSTPFDREGVATPESRVFVEDGVLKSYVLSSYSARRLGMQTTANAGGVHNLTLTPTEGDLKQMLAKMDTGLLVTELIGHGVNLVTGDYSRGAAGFWVEKGEIQYPVHEITIAGNLKDMFKNAIAAGNDIDCRSSLRTGSILLDSMTIAGQ